MGHSRSRALELTESGKTASVQLFGYTLQVGSLEGLASRVLEHVLEDRGGLRLFALNPAKVAMAQKSPELRGALQRAEVLFPDGHGVCWAARLITGRAIQRVPGIDLATALLAQAAERGLGVYLLGARAEVNEVAAQVLRRHHPGLSIVGTRHGFFSREEDRAIVEEINRAGPRILFVALGSPAQELWIDRYFDVLEVDVALGVGGSFDVYAGAVARAPSRWRRVGLEWLYRLLRQPDRVKPFLKTHPRFVWRTFLSVVRQHLKPGGP